MNLYCVVVQEFTTLVVTASFDMLLRSDGMILCKAMIRNLCKLSAFYSSVWPVGGGGGGGVEKDIHICHI